MSFLQKGLMRRVLSAVMSIVMLSSLVAPQLAAQSRWGGGNDGYYNDSSYSSWDRGRQSEGQEPGRTVGGSIGMAAGMVGGAALAHAVIGAAGIAAWGPLAVALIGASITVGGAFAGAKLFSNLGGKFTQALGRDNMWMMIGAAMGAVAAIALIGSGGIFAGAAGLIAKGMIGGIAGGVIGKLFAPQLEALATPRNLMMGAGGLIGGLGGGIPGAIAGAVGGYALGAIMDDHFFSQPGDSISNYLPFTGNTGDITSSIKDGWSRLTNWGRDKKDDANRLWNDNYHRDQYYDPYYRQSYEMARGEPFGYDSPYDQNYQYYEQDYNQGYYSQDDQTYGQMYNQSLQTMQQGGRMTPEMYRQYQQAERGRYDRR